MTEAEFMPFKLHLIFGHAPVGDLSVMFQNESVGVLERYGKIWGCEKVNNTTSVRLDHKVKKKVLFKNKINNWYIYLYVYILLSMYTRCGFADVTKSFSEWKLLVAPFCPESHITFTARGCYARSPHSDGLNPMCLPIRQLLLLCLISSLWRCQDTQ